MGLADRPLKDGVGRAAISRPGVVSHASCRS